MQELGISRLLDEFRELVGAKLTAKCLNDAIESLEFWINEHKESREQRKKELGMTDVDINKEITDLEKTRENCIEILKSSYNEGEMNRQLELEKLHAPALFRNKPSSQPSLNFSLITKIAIIIVIFWLILKRQK